MRRYDTLLEDLLALIRERPELGQTLLSAPSYLKVEAYYAVAAEGALHLDDLLTRLTRISIETQDRGEAAAQEIAEIVAPLLGWDEADTAREVAHYQARVTAERHSQDQPDDHTADAARLDAPDVRLEAAM
jgi:glycerol-3-phosphate dehydrogenase